LTCDFWAEIVGKKMLWRQVVIFQAIRWTAAHLLAAIDPATRYTSMQPPSAKLCSHPVQRYAATDWAGQDIIHAVGVFGEISVS
jgi:hypothetical protein